MDNATLGDFNFTGTVYKPTGIYLPDVIADICTQIEGKIVLGLGFIVLYWFLSRVIAPISKEGFADIPEQYKELVNTIFDKGLSLIETLMLGFSALIMGYYVIQNGWTATVSVFAWIIGVLSVLVIFYKFKTRGKTNWLFGLL